MKKVKANKTACLEKVSLVCKTKRNIVTKVVEMTLENARPLLRIIPELQIIHLLRDPRAVLNSRVVTTNWYKSRLKSPEMINNDIQVTCQ